MYRASRKMPSTSQCRTCPPDLRLRGHYGYPAVMEVHRYAGLQQAVGTHQNGGPLIVLQVAVVIPAAGGAGHAKVREAQMRTRVEGSGQLCGPADRARVLSRWSPSSP